MIGNQMIRTLQVVLKMGYEMTEEEINWCVKCSVDLANSFRLMMRETPTRKVNTMNIATIFGLALVEISVQAAANTESGRKFIDNFVLKEKNND